MTQPAVVLEIAPGVAWNADPTGNWVAITDDLLWPWTLEEGKEISDVRIRPSTFRLTLKNDAGDYDPENSGGAYAGDLNPLLHIRLRATHNTVTHDLFRGFVMEWPNTVIDHAKPIVSIVALDGLTVMHLLKVNSPWDLAVSDLLPRAWYKLNESSGTVAADYSGNGYHGTWQGSPAFVTNSDHPIIGRNANAPVWDGVDDRISLPLGAAPDGAEPWTVMGWFRAVADADGAYIYWHTFAETGPILNTLSFFVSRTSSGYLKVIHTGPDESNQSTWSDTEGVTDYQDDVWYFGVATFDGLKTVKLYVDAVLVDDSNPATDNVAPVAPTAAYIGFVNTFYEPGDVIEVVILDEELTQSQITTLYGAALVESELTSERIATLLDLVGWPSGLRDLDTGISTMVAMKTADFSLSGLDVLIQAAETENGFIYVAGDGRLTFRNRHQRSRFTVDDTYSDDGNDVRVFSDWRYIRGDHGFYTVAQVTDADGNVIEVVGDNAATYARRVITRTTKSATAGEAADYANWLNFQFGTPRTRFDRLSIRAFPGSNNTQWAAMLSREQGDLLNVEVTTPAGDLIDEDFFVERIRLIADAGMWWQILQLSAANGQRMFTLGQSKLGGEDPLGW